MACTFEVKLNDNVSASKGLGDRKEAGGPTEAVEGDERRAGAGELDKEQAAVDRNQRGAGRAGMVGKDRNDGLNPLK